jgi:outer membrane protein TolC
MGPIPSFLFRNDARIGVRRLTLLLALLAPLGAGAAHAQATAPAADSLAAGLLTVDDVVDRVVRTGFDVRVARGTAAIAARTATRGAAGYLPSLDGTVRYQGTEASRLNTGVGPGGGPGIPLTSYNTTRTGVDLTWTVLDVGRGPTYRGLRADRTRAQAESAATLDAALQDAVTAYYDVVRQEQVLGAVRETVALSEERLRLATVQARAGTASELDAGLARVDLNADRAALLRQEAVLVALRNDLSLRMGGSGTETFAVAPEIPVGRGLRLAPLLAAAQRDNRQLAATRSALDGAEWSVAASRRQRLPRLALQSGYQFSGFAEGTDPAPFNQDDSFTFGAAVTLPLFDGFNRRREIETTELRAENARTAVEQATAQVRAAVGAAHARYEAGLQRMTLETENVAVARRNVEIAYAQLRAGTITAVDLRQVQVSLLDAQTRLFDATFGAKQAETELRRLGGTLAPTSP